MDVREAVLAHFPGVRPNSSSEWPCRCPHPDHDDHNPSASVNPDKGVWVCYGCGRGGRVDEVLGITLAEPSLETLYEILSAELQPWEVTTYPEAYLALYAAPAHPYWASRFSEDIIREFNLGFDPDTNRATYPMREPTGRLVGVVGRSLDGQRPKYLYPRNVIKTNYLFGYERLSRGLDILVVVESATNVMALAEVDIPAVGIYGSRMSECQKLLVNSLNPTLVITAFDQDNAGRRATESFFDHPTDTLTAIASWSAEEANDVAELSPRRRWEVVAAAALCM